MSSNFLQRLPPGSRVAVIRLRSLGDCVLTTPAITLLKQHRPDLRLGVVVEDRFAAVFAGNPGIEEILQPTAAAVVRWKPELTINLHGGSTSSQLTFASRARWRAGFEHFRFRALYNVRIPRAQLILGVERRVHTAEHLASVIFFLGAPAQEIPRAGLFVTEKAHHDSGRYVVIHPKASAVDKTWDAGKFGAVARHLAQDVGLEPVFIAGPGESLDEFADYRCVAGGSLEEIKGLLAGAALFVGNDSGPAHMAAAFGVPVMVLFGASDPVIWAPWRTECQVLTSPEGIGGIGVEQALAALTRLQAAPAR